MAIAYRCPQCQFSHTAPDSLAGQTVTCSFCESPVVVPGGQAVADDPFLPPTPGRKPVVAAISEAQSAAPAEPVVPGDDPFAPPLASPADSTKLLSAEFQPALDSSLLPPTAAPAAFPAAQISPAPAVAVPTAAVPIAAIPAAPIAAVPAPIAIAGPAPIEAALVEAEAAPIVAVLAAPVGLTDAQWRVESEGLVRTRVPLTERIHNRFARIPERKLTAAIGTYAQGATPGDALVLLDNTMQGTGRNGFVMTSRDLFYFGGQHGDRGRAAVRDIHEARVPDQATILVSLSSGGLARILASCVKGSVPYLVEFFNQLGRLNAAASQGVASATSVAGGSFFDTGGFDGVEDDVVDDVEIVDDAAGGGVEALLRQCFPHDVKACCYRRDQGIPQKALAGATAAYAMGVQPADVLALFDNTGVLSGECGVLFTPHRLYYHSEAARKAGQIPYGQIRSAEDDSRGDSRLILLRTISGATVPIEYEVARNHGAALLELFRRIAAMGA